MQTDVEQRVTSNGSQQPVRPSDRQIIEVLSLHYQVHESMIIKWLFGMDLREAGERMVAKLEQTLSKKQG